MASKIEILWKQALKTFCGSTSFNYKMCLKSFDKLRCMIDELKAEDVYLDKNILDYVQIQPAPMCVIDVFENQDITIAIFILKCGVTLPMHDHPEMHGLLKVISGVVKIDNYSIEANDDKILEPGKIITAIKHPSIIVRPSDPACVLTPFKNNLHEITCIEGPAAFLDVLSPPYDTEEDREDKRLCTYYKVVTDNEASDKTHLIVINTPSNFYSRSIKYMGQPLSQIQRSRIQASKPGQPEQRSRAREQDSSKMYSKSLLQLPSMPMPNADTKSNAL